jgi:membrane protein YqaA with SNARE-associated domain
LRWAFRAAAAYGGLGIFVLAFLDSTFLSFPFIVDILIIHASITKPEWMPVYVGVATAGSLGGCLLLYFLARKGGEAFFKRYAKHFGAQAERIVKKHALWGIAIPAVLPPPFPFEVFTIASGVFQAPLGQFIAGVVIGRMARFLLEGLLALKYGRTINRFVMRHQDGLAIAFIVVGVLGGVALFLYSRYEKRTRGRGKVVAH